MIDWRRIDELKSEIGQEDFEEVVVLFLEEVESAIGALNPASDFESWRDSMHFLKGSAMNLGFEELASLCQKGETDVSHHLPSSLEFQAIQNTFKHERKELLAREKICITQ